MAHDGKDKTEDEPGCASRKKETREDITFNSVVKGRARRRIGRGLPTLSPPGGRAWSNLPNDWTVVSLIHDPYA